MLGEHPTSKGYYWWPEGMGPEALAPIPLVWWEAVLQIVQPPTAPESVAQSKVSSTSSKGNWRRLEQCPICGRSERQFCSIHRDGRTIRCFHGSTFNPVHTHGLLRAGQEIRDLEGTIWAFSREQQSAGETFSIFVAPDPHRRQHQSQSAPPEQQQQQAEPAQKPQPRRELTPHEKISAMRDLAADLLDQKTPFPDRVPLLRARAETLDLTLRDQELQRLLWDARRARAGTINPLGTGEVIDLSPCPWHWEGMLMAECLNLIAALPKTGKTSLLLALIGAWRRGQPDFLGIPLIGPCPPVLIVGTDQPASDWGRMLREVGLLGDRNEILPPIVALFHKGRPLHLDYEGNERIAGYAAEHPRLLILLDSISACTISLGLDENSAEIVEPINDLMEAVSPHGATVLAIHHSSKGRQGESATLASRGSTALPAAASQVIALARMASPLAGPPDRRLVLKTEGRGGMPQQLLIERTEDGWINHGSAEAVAQAQALQEMEAKLTDRQADALEVVRNRWSEGQERTDAQSLAATLKMRGDGNRKARSTLDQLAKKGLLQSVVEVGLQGRNKWFWPVDAEGSRGVLSDDSQPSEPSEPLAHVDPLPNPDCFLDKSSEGKEGSEGLKSTPREGLRTLETSKSLDVIVEGEPGWRLVSDHIPESGNVLAVDPDGRNHHVAASGVKPAPNITKQHPSGGASVLKKPAWWPRAAELRAAGSHYSTIANQLHHELGVNIKGADVKREVG